MLIPLASPTLKFETGYVTLADIGRNLIRQGVSVRVAEGGDDVYAIHAPRTDWPSLRSALLADGRLKISDDGGTWTISLDSANREAERKALAEYQESVRSQIHDLCEPAARLAKAWFGLPFTEYAALKSTQGGFPAPTDAKAALSFEWARDARDEGDYARVAIPAFLSAFGSQLGAVWTADEVNATPLIAPNGNVQSNYYIAESFGGSPESRARAEAGLGAARFAGKLVWDPLTLTTGFRWGYWTPAFASGLDHIYGGLETWRLTPKWWRSDESVPLKVPKTEWQQASSTQNSKWASEATMPPRSVFVTEAALRWAREKHESFVAYVSPLGDLPLAAKAKRSLESAVRDLDAGTLDRTGVAAFVKAWAGEEGGYPFWRVTSLPPARRATLLRAGGFTVLRTESRFLDGLIASELNVPPSWMNSRLGAAAPTLEEIVRHVAALHPKHWTSAYFPVAMLDWCDPVSFYPFAILFVGEPGLLRQIEIPGERPSRRLDDLRNPSRFRRAVEEVTPFNDDVGGLGIDPLFATFALRDAEASSRLNISADRNGFWCNVSVSNPDGSNEKDVWRASIQVPLQGKLLPAP